MMLRVLLRIACCLLVGEARAQDRDELVIEWSWLPVDFDWLLDGPWPWLLAAAVWVATRLWRRRERDRPTPAEKIEFAQIDTETPIHSAEPGKLIVLKVTAPGADAVAVNLCNPRNAEGLELTLDRLDAGSAVWVSEPVWLLDERQSPAAIEAGEAGESDSIQPPTIMVRAGDSVTAVYGQRTTALTIEGPPAAPQAGLRLEAVGNTEVVLDLDARPEAGITVRLTDGSGRPVGGERLLWVIGEHGEAVMTATDESGLSVLTFAPGSGGRLVATMEDLLLTDHIARGTHKVTVVPEDETLYPMMESAPVTFAVDLRAPTLLAILGDDFTPAMCLHPEIGARFQVVLGSAAATPAMLEGTVTGPDGESFTVELLRKSQTSIYESDGCTLQADRDEATVTFACAGRRVQLPWGKDASAAALVLIRGELRATKATIAAAHATMAMGDPRFLLGLKSKLIDNALEWIVLARDWGALAVAIGQTYLDLLEADADELGAVARHAPAALPGFLKGARIRYWCEGEQAAVDGTLCELDRLIRSKFAGFYRFAALESVKFMLGAQLGAYTAITGRTAEGERATRLERVLGGVAALAALAPAGIAIARYNRAAKAFARMETLTQKIAARTWGEAIERGAFAVPAEFGQRAVARLAAEFERAAVKRDAPKMARRLDGRITEIDQKLADARSRIPVETAELARLQSLRLKLKAAKQPMRKIAGEIRSAKSRVSGLQDLIPGLETRLAATRLQRAALRGELDSLAVGRELTRRELEQMRKAGLLPDPKDLIEGVKAERLYELQVDTFLAAGPGGWRGGLKWPIAWPHKATTWGRRFHVSPKKTVAPRTPDHIDLDPKSLHGADSKQFNGWPERYVPGKDARTAPSLVDWRIAGVVDTIEKTRLVQYHLLRAQMPGAAPRAIWAEVWKRRVTIVTPVRVRQYFSNCVRARVRGAGRNVHFQVVPIDLRTWAAALARADARLR